MGLCGSCGESFSMDVWHCSECDHHWSKELDPHCKNC